MSEARKLAAILVADVVGYSRLAGADEESARSRALGASQRSHRRRIAAHHARIVKRTDDGSRCRLPAAGKHVEATRFKEPIMDTRIQNLSAVAACAALFFAAQTVEMPARGATVADFYELAKPAGDGPFPAVVLAPGCGGFHDQYSPPVFDQYRKRLVEAGFVVVNVDFAKGHDIPACASNTGLLITQEEYSKDILSAVADLKKNSFVDPARIHLLGWSYGGGAALNALALAEESPDVKIKSVVAFFPYCGSVRSWKQSVPVLVLRGDADDMAPFGKCAPAVQTALDNKSMRDIVYPGALHSFDQFTVPQPLKNRFGTFGYNEAATKSAWRELETFLKE